MKQVISICLVIGLIITATASAQQSSAPQPPKGLYDLEGQTWATGHLGYAFGMGSAFQSYSDPFSGSEISSDAGLGFGGQFYYGLKKNFMIGGELLFQSYSVSFRQPANLSLGIPEIEVSDSQTELNLLANTMYAVRQSKKSALFLMGGTGFYDFGGMKLGLNSGLFWRTQVSDNVHLFGMPRLHLVLTDNSPTMVQLTMGAQFSLGG